MSTEKKLEYFTQAIEKEVEYKKRYSRQQMSAKVNDEVEKAVAEAKAEAKIQIQAQQQAIEKANNKRILEAISKTRRSYITLRERLTANLFDQIKTRVCAFTKSPEYEAYLIKSIQTAKTASKHHYQYVQLTPEDMAHAASIQNATGLTPEPGSADILGGFRLLTPSRGIVSEHTLSAGLTMARQEFSVELTAFVDAKSRQLDE